MSRLTRKMKIKLDGMGIVGSTPMLLPSLSSRAEVDIKETLQSVNDIITGPFLISAYDIHYTEDFPKITFPELIFIDSGGYECLVDKKVSELNKYRPNSKDWDESLYMKTISEWNSPIPTVIISYDHPREKKCIQDQINDSKKIFDSLDGVLNEILVKAEKNSHLLNFDNVLNNLESMNSFDILGFTEKEIGKSVFERMINIANLRLRMEELDIQIPLHILGSLDTVITPLFYLSGADIFDGLSWLRFAFDEETGSTSYIQSFGPKKEGITIDSEVIKVKCIYNNYTYLRNMEMKLKKFHSSKDFKSLGYNFEFFKESFEYLSSEVGGVL